MGKTNRHKHHQTTAKSNSSSAPDSNSVEFIKHVHEFRSRIFWVALLFIVTSAVAYQYRDVLVDLVLSPLGQQQLIYLTPAGGFSFIFQITMYAGAVITAPFLVFQLYKFVTPALPVRARKHAALIFIVAILLMCSGVAFGYFVAVPSALSFLTTFAGGYVDASLTADSYLNFVLAYVVGLGILFQIPLLLIFWHWIKPITPKKLLSSERFMVVFSLIAAAIITPTPDVVNQLLIAGPILVIYQIGVITVLVMIRKERKRQRRRVHMQSDKSVAIHPRQAQHPALILPSLEDLTPRQRTASVTHHIQKARPAHPPSSAPIKPKVVSVVSSPSKVISHPKPSMDVAPLPQPSFTRSTTTLRPRGVERAYRSRSVSMERPLPSVSRSGRPTLDGFMASS